MFHALRCSLRLAKAGWTFARHGVFGVLDTSTAPPPVRTLVGLARLVERRKIKGTRSARLSSALTALGPSYIKLGQFLATRRDIVGDELAADLSLLQDKLPAFPQKIALKEIEITLGGPIETFFSEISEPVAAASIAQVHKAVTLDGRTVAVKVLRPGVAKRFARDLTTYFFAARMAERLVPELRRLRPVDVVQTLARTTQLEMDFRLEAAAISEMAGNISRDEGFRVPDVDWTRTSKSVLTTEWINGIPLSKVEAVRASNHDLKALGAGIIQHFLRHAMRDGFFHADMHQGNLFVEPDGTLVAVDFGIMGRLKPAERRFLAEILYGFIRRDYRRVSEVHFEARYVPDTHDVDMFAQALRAIGEPLMGMTADKISMARLLSQLLEVTDLFDMRTQTQLILLQKTMVVVEGVGRTLDPELNMWETAEPVVRDWIESNLGPEGRLQDAAQGAQLIGRFVAALPELLVRAERTAEMAEAMSINGLRLDKETVEAIARAQAQRGRASQAALWVGAIALAAMAARMFM